MTGKKYSIVAEGGWCGWGLSRDNGLRLGIVTFHGCPGSVLETLRFTQSSLSAARDELRHQASLDLGARIRAAQDKR